MKLIPKMMQGGGYTPLFADYQVVNGAPSIFGKSSGGGRQSSSGDSEKGKLSEKDLFSLFKDVDGLPNEIDKLTVDVNRMYDLASLYNDGFDTSLISSMYAKVASNIKKANFNKKEYDKAYTLAEKNLGLEEFAVGASGKLVVYDLDKKMTQVSVQEYLSNLDKYLAITNSNILWLRAHDPQFVNNNLVFDIVNNSIGINKITELIEKHLPSLGTSEESREGYAVKSNGKVMLGLQILQDAAALGLVQQAGMTVDGLYKTKVITKELKQQAESALRYVYLALPENARTVLQVRSGNAENPTLGALDFIGNLIMAKSDSYYSISSDLQENLNLDGSKKESGSKGSKGSIDDEDLNTASQFLAGYGDQSIITINPGTNLAIDVLSSSLPLVKKDGTPLGANCSLQEVTLGQYSGILDWNKVMMGGRKVDPSSFNLVIINDSQISSIDFPVDENGNPDLRPTTIQAKNEADKKFKAAGIDIDDPNSRAQHASEMNQILEECGLSAAYDSQGNIIGGRWRRFAVMNGTADNRALGVDPLEGQGSFLHEVTDETKIDNLISILKDKMDVDKYEFDKNNWGWFEGDYDMLLEGTIWIPVKENYFNSQAGSGEKISGKLGNELETRLQISNRRDYLLQLYKLAAQP